METEINKLKLLRSFALGVLIAGALGSLYLTETAGENNKSLLLRFLFMVWVLSPFLALIGINLFFQSWPYRKRISLYLFMLAVTVGSLIFYSDIYKLHVFKNAFLFLATPLMTWLLMAIGYLIFRFRKSF